MTYTNKMRRPTRQALEDQCVPLVQQYEAGGEWHDAPYYPTFTQLKSFMLKHGIPQSAQIVYGSCGSHTIELVW